MLPPLEGITLTFIPFNHANTDTPNFSIAVFTGKLHFNLTEKKFQAHWRKKEEL